MIKMDRVSGIVSGLQSKKVFSSSNNPTLVKYVKLNEC